MVKHTQRRRRREFLDFMNEVIRDVEPGREVHVVLDNLKTHKPKHDQWLARHKNARFHYTPTHASWLNQIEIWFSILQAQSLRGASFTSINQLRQHIDAFAESYNITAQPFEWHKVTVRNKNLKTSFPPSTCRHQALRSSTSGDDLLQFIIIQFGFFRG